jgi:quercetin dioxygenase-like cupin family protein
MSASRTKVPVLALVIATTVGAGPATTRTGADDDRKGEIAVPVEEEPFHKVVLRNDFVIALHVTLPAGQTTQLHTHSHDGAAIRLSDALVSMRVPGAGPTAPVQVRPGDVSVATRRNAPLTHRVINAGRTTFEVLDLEFLKRPDGPPTEPVAPPAAENATARVYLWRLAPGASSPPHTHVRPYVIVAATPMQLLMTSPDGTRMEHPVAAGDLHWIDAKVAHTLTNHGTAPGVIVEVEVR